VSGNAFELETADARLTLATSTANALAAAIPYGVAVVDLGSKLVAVPDGSLTPLTPVHVVTITPTAVNSTVYAMSVVVDDIVYPVNVTSDGSATATEISAALIAALNTALPANSVVASGTDTVVLTSEVPGQLFTVSVGANLAVAVTTQGKRITDVLAGVTLRHNVDEQPAAGTVAGYPGGSVMSVLQRGEVWVSTEEAVSDLTASVYVRTGSTGQKGAFRASAAAGCVKLPRDKARWVKSSSSTMAALRIDLF
jgi:hypothetical protein